MAVGTLLILAGCSTVPVEQVQGYTQAFDEASAAGNRLYDEVGPVIAREQAKADAKAAVVAAGQTGDDPAAVMPAAGPTQGADAVCLEPTDPPLPYRTCFVPSDFAPGGMPGEPESLVARRRALATITTYNAIALRLASGETASALGAEVQRLGANASSLAALTGAGPAIGVATNTLADLAKWVESLRADQELRRALADGSPYIDQLLQALIADTPQMYTFKLETTAARLEHLQADAGRISFDIQDIVRAHASFATLASVDRRYGSARARLALPTDSLTTIAGTQGTTPLNAAAAEELDGLLVQQDALGPEYEAQVADLDRYYAALGEYVRMLHGSYEALQLAVATAKSPQTVTLDPAALAVKATEIRDQAREVERLLNT
jgi:hypothetical protein